MVLITQIEEAFSSLFYFIKKDYTILQGEFKTDIVIAFPLFGETVSIIDVNSASGVAFFQRNDTGGTHWRASEEWVAVEQDGRKHLLFSTIFIILGLFLFGDTLQRIAGTDHEIVHETVFQT